MHEWQPPRLFPRPRDAHVQITEYAAQNYDDRSVQWAINQYLQPFSNAYYLALGQYKRGQMKLRWYSSLLISNGDNAMDLMRSIPYSSSFSKSKEYKLQSVPVSIFSRKNLLRIAAHITTRVRPSLSLGFIKLHCSDTHLLQQVGRKSQEMKQPFEAPGMYI